MLLMKESLFVSLPLIITPDRSTSEENFQPPSRYLANKSCRRLGTLFGHNFSQRDKIRTEESKLIIHPCQMSPAGTDRALKSINLLRKGI